MRPFTIAILNFISSVSSHSSLQQEAMNYSMIFKVLYFKQIVGINKILEFKSNSDYVLLIFETSWQWECLADTSQELFLSVLYHGSCAETKHHS